MQPGPTRGGRRKMRRTPCCYSCLRLRLLAAAPAGTACCRRPRWTRWPRSAAQAAAPAPGALRMLCPSARRSAGLHKVTGITGQYDLFLNQPALSEVATKLLCAHSSVQLWFWQAPRLSRHPLRRLFENWSDVHLRIPALAASAVAASAQSVRSSAPARAAGSYAPHMCARCRPIAEPFARRPPAGAG